MASLAVEGETLGEKHRNYNKIFNETTLEVIPNIDYEEPDLDNLLKIDIACRDRNVDYVIKVMQCEDMLYISRTIKRATWLVTDPQYAHIVNPTHLNDQLSPTMMKKAFTKFLRYVRLNLKDEKRVDEFFNYYEERDLEAAFRWLPNCSVPLIEAVMRRHSRKILFEPYRFTFSGIIKRLCEKSSNCMETYTSNSVPYYASIGLTSALHLTKDNIDKHLDTAEYISHYTTCRFGKRTTKFIIDNCSEKIKQNPVKYLSVFHVPTFLKFIKPEDIKEFIRNNISKRKMRPWFRFNKLKPLVGRLPIESRFDFIKEVFIDNDFEDDSSNVDLDCSNSESEQRFYLDDVYRWYEFAPFTTAFTDLRKLINFESKSTNKFSMIKILIACAGKNMRNIQTLLLYYRDNLINEPVKFKIEFVNLIISSANTHRFDEETWRYLNDLFNSIDVYSETANVDQNIIRSITLRHVIREESVPGIIEKKFKFDTLKTNQRRLSKQEKEKTFSYLYKHLISKMDACEDFIDTVGVLNNLLNLLADWNKELQYFPIVLNKIKETIDIALKNNWIKDVAFVYDVKKAWKKLLFAESLALSPTREVCVNALKHGPELLVKNKNEVEVLCLNDIKNMENFLKKIRIYLSSTLADTYKEFFYTKIDDNDTNKAAIYGLCVLLPQNDLTDLIHKYAPNESKIDSPKPDDVDLNVRKHIAASLRLARPRRSPADVLLYAKGEYRPFALSSLNAVLYNMNVTHTHEYLPQLLNGPIPLKKLGIFLSFEKLQSSERIQMLYDVWKNNKNRNIRLAIFNQTFKCLCKGVKPYISSSGRASSVTRETWKLLSAIIEDLTSKENKKIYKQLSKIENVPLSVQPEFWTKSYKFLKSLPSTLERDDLLRHLRDRNPTSEIMEFLDNDSAVEIFLDSFDDNFSTKDYDFMYLVGDLLMRTKSEPAHMERYNKVLVPMLERSFVMWNKSRGGTNYVRKNLEVVLLNVLTESFILRGKNILPIATFTDILTRLLENISIHEGYVLITTYKLSLECVKIMDKVLKRDKLLASAILESTEDNKFDALNNETAPELGQLCVNYLKEDVATYFPSIYVHFAKAFNNVCNCFNFNNKNKTNLLKAILECEEFIPGYLFAIILLKSYHDYSDDKNNEWLYELMNEIRKHPFAEVKMHCSYKKLV